MGQFASKYRAGDWVEVRSVEEIVSTLGADAALDRLPFMPEMLPFCGKRFRVAASAHKTCDTAHKTGGRRMKDAVHLEGVRCDGSAHGGCQAQCLIFWKEEWIRPVGGEGTAPRAEGNGASRVAGGEAPLGIDAVRANAAGPGDRPDARVFSCQTTRLFDATTPLKSWTPAQFVADVTSRNVSAVEAARVLVLAMIFNLRRLPTAYRLTRWLYDRAHSILVGGPSPYGTGSIRKGQPTPHEVLDLKPGEYVRVKPHQEILATLDVSSRNRGLYFDKEMVRYCGQVLRVAARVERILEESTGRVLKMPTASVALEGAYCTSQYSERRLLCPRRIVPYWREIWLERVAAPSGGSATTAAKCRTPELPG